MQRFYEIFYPTFTDEPSGVNFIHYPSILTISVLLSIPLTPMVMKKPCPLSCKTKKTVWQVLYFVTTTKRFILQVLGKNCPTASLQRELECKECQLDENGGKKVGTSKRFTCGHLHLISFVYTTLHRKWYTRLSVGLSC